MTPSTRRARTPIERRWFANKPFAAVISLAAVVLVCLSGCGRKKEYSQESPDDVVRSAIEMVKNGDTRQLSNLVYADSPEMRLVLNRLGELFGHMQVLAKEVEKRFPSEMAELKQRAAEAAAAGKPDPLLAAIAAGAGGNGGSSRRSRGGQGLGGGPPMDDGSAQDLVNQLFADPYGWIERNAGRITAMKTGDDTASVMLDDKPIIPVVGLPMRLEAGKWYITLPMNFPGVANVMPRSREQWSILMSVIKVLDRTVVEMTADVQAGRVATLDSLSKQAREKAVLPGVIAFAAYGREMEVRGRVERRVKQFQARQRDWVKDRSDREKSESAATVSPKLVALINKLAPGRIEPLVRKNKAPSFDKLSPSEFEAMVSAWLGEAGLRIALDGDLSSPRVDAEIARWEAQSIDKK